MSAATRWRWAAALAAVLALAGCGGLPTSSTVERGLPVLGAPLQGVQALPDGPEEGASAQDILRGFLLANVSFDDDHEVARQFLTAELARTWVPTQRTLVYAGDPELQSPRDGLVVASVTALGVVDAKGYLTEFAEGTRTSASFSVEDVADQWRISGFPDEYGLWLSEADFERTYRSAQISYLAPHRRVFVPDVRWFPRGDGLPTALARALIEQPPDYLAGAVTTAVPKGAELAAAAVPVDPTLGVATVELRGLGAGAEPGQTERLLAQFSQTLLQAPGVSGVQVRSEEGLLPTSDVEGPVEDSSQVGYEPAATTVPYALLRSNVELEVVDPFHSRVLPYTPDSDTDTETSAPGPLPDIPVRWSHLAADADLTDLAAVSVDGRTLSRWRGTDQLEVDGLGTRLTPPSFDRLGGLWVAGRSGSGARIWVLDTSGAFRDATPTAVEADWIGENEDVVAFRVAPDDQRAVIHLRDTESGADRLGLVGIVRDRDGRAVALSEPQPVGQALAHVETVDWASGSQLVVLGRAEPELQVLPYVLNLGGWMSPLRGVADARVVKGVPAAEQEALVLIDGRGRVYTQERDDWYFARNGDDLVVPGN